jgi:hypothetical protein
MDDFVETLMISAFAVFGWECGWWTVRYFAGV